MRQTKKCIWNFYKEIFLEKDYLKGQKFFTGKVLKNDKLKDQKEDRKTTLNPILRKYVWSCDVIYNFTVSYPVGSFFFFLRNVYTELLVTF